MVCHQRYGFAQYGVMIEKTSTYSMLYVYLLENQEVILTNQIFVSFVNETTFY